AVVASWQPEGKYRPVARAALDVDRAAVLFDDLAHRGKAEPDAKALRCEERFKDPGQYVGRDTRSRVDDEELEMRSCRHGSHGYLATARRRLDPGPVGHGLDGVV